MEDFAGTTVYLIAPFVLVHQEGHGDPEDPEQPAGAHQSTGGQQSSTGSVADRGQASDNQEEAPHLDKTPGELSQTTGSTRSQDFDDMRREYQQKLRELEQLKRDIEVAGGIDNFQLAPVDIFLPPDSLRPLPEGASKRAGKARVFTNMEAVNLYAAEKSLAANRKELSDNIKASTALLKDLAKSYESMARKVRDAEEETSAMLGKVEVIMDEASSVAESRAKKKMSAAEAKADKILQKARKLRTEARTAMDELNKKEGEIFEAMTARDEIIRDLNYMEERAEQTKTAYPKSYELVTHLPDPKELEPVLQGLCENVDCIYEAVDTIRGYVLAFNRNQQATNKPPKRARTALADISNSQGVQPRLLDPTNGGNGGGNGGGSSGSGGSGSASGNGEVGAPRILPADPFDDLIVPAPPPPSILPKSGAFRDYVRNLCREE